MTHRLFEDENHTLKYYLYRPNYPKELYQHIINYYFNKNPTNEKIPLALDVACGSGQATVQLSTFCDQVIAIDVSENQIANATQKDNITYRCHNAEDLSFLPSNSTDLVTVATALHWFDIERFIEEVKRVLKPGTGVFAVWTYGLLLLDNQKANDIYHEYFEIKLASYWDSKRFLVDDYYRSILSLFPYQSTRQQYTVESETEITIEQFIGLVQSYSIWEKFKREQGDKAYNDLIEEFREKITNCYANDDKNSIKINISSPLEIYLMKKIEEN